MALANRLTPAELADAVTAGDTLLLDVRTPTEYGTARIPGSINVPVDLIEKNATAIGAGINRDAVLICRMGPRAERAEQALAKVGVPHTSVLVGGFEAWRDAGHDVEFGQARWDLERQVRLVAGSLVATGVLASTVVPKAKWLSGAVGGGLMFAALSNTCAMGTMLSKLPYNRSTGTPSVSGVRKQLS